MFAASSRRALAPFPRRRRTLTARRSSRPSRAVASSDDARECVLAVDVGTTALKAIVLTPAGVAVAVAERAYRVGTVLGGGANLSGAVEQDPDDWLEAFGLALRDLGYAADADPADALPPPAAIALSGQMQDVCLVRDGRSVRASLLYSDVRAAAEAARVVAACDPDDVDAKLANFKGPAACLAKWLWLATHEPDALKAADRVLLGAHSFLAYALTDGDAAFCDPTTASTTGLLSPAALGAPPRWAEDVLRLFPEIDLTQLPNLLTGESPDPVGTVSARAAKALGVASAFAGAPVYHGVGDLASATTGAMGTHRADRDGSATRAYVYLGTSGWIATCAPWETTLANAARDGTFRLSHPNPDSAIVAASMVTAGGNAEWARRALLPEGRNSLRDLDAAAANAPAGCDGTLFLPHLNGERSPFVDASARGAFLNVSARTDADAMCRAVLEGVAYNYRALAESLDVTLGPDADPIPFVGGGARSALWTQTLADALRTPVAPVADAATVAARGCAAGAFANLGAWGDGGAPAGYFPGGAGDEGEPTVQPDPITGETHERNYAVFARVHAALADAGVGTLVA